MRPCRPLPLAPASALVAAFMLAASAPAALGAQDAPPRASFDSAWAAVSRSYWDTSFVAGPWRAVHDSLRATLAPDADAPAVRAAIRALIAVPRQSHFVLLPALAVPTAGASAAAGEPGSARLELRAIGDEIVVWRVEADGPAARADLRAGDVVLVADTLDVDEARATLRDAMVAERAAEGAAAEPVDAAARLGRLLVPLVTARLAGPAGAAVRLTVARDGAVLERTVTRAPLMGLRTQYGNLPPFAVRVSSRRVRDIAIVRFNAWFPVATPALDSALFAARDARGLVIDLRGNPGGVVGMIAGVAGHLLDSVVALGEMRARGSTLRFSANPRVVDAAGAARGTFRGPVAVLVDAGSASTSEFFASGLQAIGRARVFGERSAGQALAALAARLPSGDVLMHVIADHRDPAGRAVEGRGVVPDEFHPLRREDLRAGVDAPLEAALAWIARTAP